MGRACLAEQTAFAAALLDLGAIIDDNEKDDLSGDAGNDTLFGGVGDKLKQ